MTTIKPTVGRVLWYHPRSSEPMVRHDSQPCMALLCWPNGETAVNLLVIDHFGTPWPVQDVELIQEGDAVPTAGGYAEWMPYQQGQAKKHAAEDLGAAAENALEEAHQRGFKEGFQAAEQMHDYADKLDLPAQRKRQGIAAGRSFPIEGYDFGCALEAAKQGQKIYRKGWNGREAGLDQFVVRMPELQLPAYNAQGPGPKVNDRTAKWIGANTPLDCRPYFAMFVDGLWQPGWIPSTADLNANDWAIEPGEDLAMTS